jgi:hypothetical protein
MIVRIGEGILYTAQEVAPERKSNIITETAPRITTKLASLQQNLKVHQSSLIPQEIIRLSKIVVV